ncbi:MAG: hypothetical protein A2Y33_06895 [Spirochaetes bacterium GWF1_51_8]|nr:MAG: hypothetical protein A2Y33_06895 [Spirochaetes bacterium GWF1_51_8]
MTIRYVRPDEYPELLELQKLAYITEAELYGDYTIPPLTQTLDDLTAECAQKTVIAVIEDGRLVGSVRACLDDNKACLVGRLMTHPDYRRRGIGRELMVRIESEFPGAVRFELFTGEKSAGNIRLYEQLGYVIFKKLRLNDKIDLVFMEKYPPPDTAPDSSESAGEIE